MSNKKKDALVPKKTVPAPPKEEDDLQVSKELNQTKVSNWLLVIGIASAVAIGTAATVYYYRRRKQRLAYMEDEDSWTLETYKSTFNKYWNLTKRTFSAVSLSVNDFFAKNKQHSPMADAEFCQKGGPFMAAHSQDHEEVLCEL